jgi:hypothetical protein
MLFWGTPEQESDTMNEEHWLVCKDPKEMVEFLICRKGGADERKLPAPGGPGRR